MIPLSVTESFLVDLPTQNLYLSSKNFEYRTLFMALSLKLIEMKIAVPNG